jgi:hypothetical protein
MRLSEIRGERVFDVIADITEPICNIAADEQASKLFSRKRPDGMDAKDFALSKLSESIPALMRNHKDDLIAILASIEGKPADEYKEGLSMAKLASGVYELLTDEDLLAFFS